MASEPAALGKLSIKDWQKGLITAALVGGLTVIAPAISAGTIFTMVVLKAFGTGAVTGLVGYLLKNLATNSEDKFLTEEPVKPTA